MRQIQANLPAIGAFRINLHKESETLIDFFGEGELARLGRIDHLGAATVVFTGINHTRLEYVLLQCAIAQLVAKLYKDNAELALANSVELDGASQTVSSGEELLKCWAILSNVGHPNWTFTTERALLDGALKNTDLRNWLVSGAVERDISNWTHKIIENYDDRYARYLLTLLRLREERPNDPRKNIFRQMIRNKVLRTNTFKLMTPASRIKLMRLRSLSQNIQLLSMVTLDAYHSHSPIRIELLPAIQELAESATHTDRLKRFFNVLESTAGWLADEVYLHPRAVAAQRAYEIRATRKALKRFKSQGATRNGRTLLLKSIMADGFGQPKPSELKPLIRLSFPLFTSRMLGSGHRHSRVERLNKEIGVKPNSLVCVDDNSFSRSTFVDVLYRPNDLTAFQFGKTYRQLVMWLLRSIEADALERVRMVLPASSRSDERVEETRVRLLKNTLKRSENHLTRVITSIVENIIPKGWSASVEATSQGNKFDIGWRLTDSRGVLFDELENRIDRLYKEEKTAGNKARAHEIAVLKDVAVKTSEQLVAALLKPLVIRNHYGQKKDEWDGAVLEIGATTIQLTVIEAKGGSKKAQRAELAFTQLVTTRKIVRSRYAFCTKRTRLPGLGASLRMKMFK